MGSTKEQTQ